MVVFEAGEKFNQRNIRNILGLNFPPYKKIGQKNHLE